jgi:hypothetical protein
LTAPGDVDRLVVGLLPTIRFMVALVLAIAFYFRCLVVTRHQFSLSAEF